MWARTKRAHQPQRSKPMEIFIAWFFLSMGVGLFASNYRNASGFGFFLVSMILSPLIGFLFAVAIKPRPVKDQSIAPVKQAVVLGYAAERKCVNEYGM